MMKTCFINCDWYEYQSGQRGISMKVSFHTIEFMSAEEDMGYKFGKKFPNIEIDAAGVGRKV